MNHKNKIIVNFKRVKYDIDGPSSKESRINRMAYQDRG